MDPFHDSESDSEWNTLRESWCSLRLPGTEIPKCLKFSHQSFGNSVSFWIGKKISKLAVCFASRSVEAHKSRTFNAYISINGCNLYPDSKYGWTEFSEDLWLCSVSLGQLNKRKLSEQNHIEVICQIRSINFDIIKWIGVNVECSCYPQNSDVTCLPLPCAMNGCGSSSIPNDTDLPPLLPVSSTSYASDLDHEVVGQWKKLYTCWNRTPKAKKNLSLTNAKPSRERSSKPWRWSSSRIQSLLHFPNNT